MDAGLTMYMFESLQRLVGEGICHDRLDKQHVIMFYRMKQQSERDTPRGSIRNGLIDTTRCQSLEWKGNFFLLMCIAHTTAGSAILKEKLGYNNRQWNEWLTFAKLYLSMEEWFHDSCLKEEEVRKSRVAIGIVIEMMQELFPRADGHGYNLPKMHGMTNMQEYVWLFGSLMNCYSGPGEASHKCFVKSLGWKTQWRVSEFATQVAEQYYNIMAVNAAKKHVDIRSMTEKIRAETDSVDVGRKQSSTQ